MAVEKPCLLCHRTLTFNHNQRNPIDENNNIGAVCLFRTFYPELINDEKFVSFRIIKIDKPHSKLLPSCSNILIYGNS